ncbi:hypothetical protein V7S43_010391 [Phytophthora oleae]|uniref:Uncharacterized protein n=1 Tax=Phytophthora oleae TaxID=2107226 RepID=A0ABD3FFF8_9STRA
MFFVSDCSEPPEGLEPQPSQVGELRGSSPLDHQEALKSLQKSGIVTDVGGYVKFTSPIAERYYYRWLFPTRARKNPTSLHELIRKAIGSMPAIALKQSVARKGDFP